MFALSHPTGNRNVREVALALSEQGILEEFWTTLAWNSNSMLNSLIPPRFRGELMRRSYPPDVQSRIRTRPLREMGRLLAGRVNRLKKFAEHETGWLSVDVVYRDLDRRVAERVRATDAIRGVYAYEDGALASFRAARERGLCAIYDLPIAYWKTARRLLEEEALRWPEWEKTLGGTRDSEVKTARKTEELALADMVVCPSRFVLDSIPPEVRATKEVVVAEFGSPEPSSAELPAGDTKRPLRVLFAGSMTQRKGLADLFEAMRLLRTREVELIVMGSPLCDLSFYRAQYSGFVYEAPRPHGAVLDLMRTCDVLVLPSIVEGRALVQQEAMASGLPLIVTPNAGGEDLIEEKRTGFLVPVRSPERIAEAIDWLATHRDEIPEMKRAAIEKALSYPWSRYRAAVGSSAARLIAGSSRPLDPKIASDETI